MQTAYNQERFSGDLPPEAVYAEVILNEVQEFISTLFGTMLRFYLPVIKYDDIDDMQEDLIELVTSLTINETLSPWLMKICRLSSREDEAFLSQKMD